jgi:hypothetical protein
MGGVRYRYWQGKGGLTTLSFDQTILHSLPSFQIGDPGPIIFQPEYNL